MSTLRARVLMASTARTLERRTTWMLGSPRSGTTWLGALLAGATGAVLIDEPLIGAHLAVPMSSVTSVPDPTHRMLRDASRGRADYVFSDATERVWRPRLRALLVARFAASVIASGRRRDAPVVIKEPNGSLAAALLLQALPRSRLLFVARDGRDVVDSMVDGASGGWISDTHGATLSPDHRLAFIEERAHQWVHTMRTVGDAFASHPPQLRLRVDYEQLLDQPVAELERIVRWLGRPVDRATLARVVDAHSFDNLSAVDRGPGQFARSATPGLWRQHFNADEQAALQEIMEPTLAELGYEPS